ncbi:MAG: hypothetical protein LBI39_01545 [Puniceicoccales bacterium]|jgi:hypothetical protein|nr:hypothetical protein [Puniceicoccales bacterium]
MVKGAKKSFAATGVCAMRQRGRKQNGFALASLVAFILLFSLTIAAMSSYAAVASRRTADLMAREFSKRNAMAAMAMAIGLLTESMDDGKCVTVTAENCCTPESRHRHWLGLWPVVGESAAFSAWAVSGGETLRRSGSAAEKSAEREIALLEDLGLGDSCPLEEIRCGDRVHGHFAFLVLDETAKVRINLPKPAIGEPHIAQGFGERLLDGLADGGERERLIPMGTFAEFRAIAPNAAPELFHAITLCGATLLQNTSGEWLTDIGEKLRPGNFAAGTYLFPGKAELPQPPPTLDLLASYLSAVGASGAAEPLKFQAGGPHFRQIYAPLGNCRCTLANLPNPAHGHVVPTRYGIHPVLCGAWLSIFARIVGGEEYDVVEVAFLPQFALWNPLAEPIEAHGYAFQWRSEIDESRWDPELSSKPALQMWINSAAPIKVPIGSPIDGSLFRGTCEAQFLPGQVLLFSPAEDRTVTVGDVAEGPFSDGAVGVRYFRSRMAIAKGSTISIGRLVSLQWDKRSRWDGMALRLCDGETQSLLQEVADFVDEAPAFAGGPLAVPRDGNFHPVFQLSASLRSGASGSPRWLVDHNPRAPQIRRSAKEHAYSVAVGPAGADSMRIYPSWSVSLRDFAVGETAAAPPLPRFFGADGRAVLFDIPRRFFSLAAIRHLNLFPFSYHPAYAVGNSWAPALLPRNCQWCEPASGHEYFAGEMLLDASRLANCALFDHYYVGGFAGGPGETAATYTHCTALRQRDATSGSMGLLNCGALNVNGASAEAWKIFLRSLPFDSSSGTYYLPRHGSQTSADLGCAALCRLSEDDVDRLAQCIWEEVCRCGPFPSLAAFVNRSLGEMSNPDSRCGLLQRAIEKANLRKFPQTEASNFHGNSAWFDGAGALGDANTLCPADLSQADLLQFFGNSLAVRGDTFTIRAYGDASDGGERSPPCAILEATVRRKAGGGWHAESVRWVR